MRSDIHRKYKKKYRVINWPEYERALVQRGNITLRISDDAIVSWKPAPTGRLGAQRKLSEKPKEIQSRPENNVQSENKRSCVMNKVEEASAKERTIERRELILGVISKSKGLFILAAGLSFLLSVWLFFTGNQQQGIYVGIWVPSILSAGALLLGGNSRE